MTSRVETEAALEHEIGFLRGKGFLNEMEQQAVAVLKQGALQLAAFQPLAVWAQAAFVEAAALVAATLAVVVLLRASLGVG